MPSKKQRAKAAKAAKLCVVTDQPQAQLEGATSATVAQATRATVRAGKRLGSDYLRGGLTEERRQALMEATVMSRPGIAKSTFAHDGSGSKRLLRERMQKKLWERKQQSV